jgi:hypothetical protein
MIFNFATSLLNFIKSIFPSFKSCFNFSISIEYLLFGESPKEQSEKVKFEECNTVSISAPFQDYDSPVSFYLYFSQLYSLFPRRLQPLLGAKLPSTTQFTMGKFQIVNTTWILVVYIYLTTTQI